MILPALFLGVALGASAGVDLSAQFSDGGRSQGDTGACHAFTATALLEAAHYRRTKTHIRLSEADLFARRIHGDLGLLVAGEESGKGLRANLKFALEHGVLPGDYFPELLARLPEYRREHLSHILQKRTRRLGDLLPPAALSPEADAARETTKAAFAGFVYGRPRTFLSASAARAFLKKDTVTCDAARRTKILVEKLDAGIPVGVGMLRGYAKSAEWREGTSGEGAHWFVVKGYAREGEKTTFFTRDSRVSAPGGGAPLAEEDLCQVYAMGWLLTSEEASR